jgi:hypothetical protein
MIRLTEKDIDISMPYYTHTKKKVQILKSTIYDGYDEIESIMVLFKNKKLFDELKVDDVKTIVFPDYTKFVGCVPVVVNEEDMYIWFKFAAKQGVSQSEYRSLKIDDLIENELNEK